MLRTIPRRVCLEDHHQSHQSSPVPVPPVPVPQQANVLAAASPVCIAEVVAAAAPPSVAHWGQNKVSANALLQPLLLDPWLLGSCGRTAGVPPMPFLLRCTPALGVACSSPGPVPWVLSCAHDRCPSTLSGAGLLRPSAWGLLSLRVCPAQFGSLQCVFYYTASQGQCWKIISTWLAVQCLCRSKRWRGFKNYDELSVQQTMTSKDDMDVLTDLRHVHLSFLQDMLQRLKAVHALILEI